VSEASSSKQSFYKPQIVKPKAITASKPVKATQQVAKVE
jgi:hypothetical protein